MTSGILWNYYRDKVSDEENENDNGNNKLNNDETTKSFEQKTKLIGRTLNDSNTLNVDVVVPLKYLSNFWKFFRFSID